MTKPWLALAPAVLLLPLVPLALRAAPRDRLAEVRDELVQVNADWDRARLAFDRAAFERMLAPDFHVRIGEQTLTRAQFVEEVSRKRPELALTRFETSLLTLAAEGSDWVAVVSEKMEAETPVAGGAPRTSYSLWITRDRFRKEGERWTILSSEAIGFEGWSDGTRPPFDDWQD